MKFQVMKNTTRKLVAMCLLSAQLINLSPAYASMDGGGAIGGGGGDNVQHSGGVEISDVYARATDDETIFDENVFELDAKVLKRTGMYIEFLENYVDVDWARTFRKSVLGENVLYLEVQQIPEYEICRNHLELRNLPEDAQVSQFACTKGSRTFVIKKQFDLFNVHQKALGLIHEGLRRWGSSDFEIASIIKGLNVAGKIYDEQVNANFHILSDSDKKQIMDMVLAGLRTGLHYETARSEYRTFKSSYMINDYGALIAKELVNKVSGKIGIASFVNFSNKEAKYSIDESAIILNTKLNPTLPINLSIGKNAFLDNVGFTNNDRIISRKIEIGDNATVISSSFDYMDSVKIENAAKVEGLFVNGDHSYPHTELFINASADIRRIFIVRAPETDVIRFSGVIDGKGHFGTLNSTSIYTMSKSGRHIKSYEDLIRYVK